MSEVKLMRDSVSKNVGVKVAGTGSSGTPEIAFGCILAGADIIGTRSGPQIIDEIPTDRRNLLWQGRIGCNCRRRRKVGTTKTLPV